MNEYNHTEDAEATFAVADTAFTVAALGGDFRLTVLRS